MLALRFDRWVEKPFYRRNTLLVIGGTRTQVFEGNMTIAASALNHYALDGYNTVLPAAYLH